MSTWHDSELMNVVNQKLNPHSSHPSHPQVPEIRKHDSKHKSSDQRLPNKPSKYRERTIKSLLQTTEPLHTTTTPSNNKGTKLLSVKSEHGIEAASARKKRKAIMMESEKSIPLVKNTQPTNKKWSDEKRREARQRMIQTWAPGGARRIAHERNRQKSFKEQGRSGPLQPHSHSTTVKRPTKKNFRKD